MNNRTVNFLEKYILNRFFFKLAFLDFGSDSEQDPYPLLDETNPDPYHNETDPKHCKTEIERESVLVDQTKRKERGYYVHLGPIYLIIHRLPRYATLV